MTKESYPKLIYPQIGNDFLVGFGQDYDKGDDFIIKYSDDTQKPVVLEDIQTQYVENPLNGLIEVTVKVQLREQE